MKTTLHLALLLVSIIATSLEVSSEDSKSAPQPGITPASPDFDVVYEFRTVTNHTVRFDTNGVETITVHTNKVKMVVSGKTDLKALKALKLEKIREEKALGKNTEIREKWEILNAKATHLREGMNLYEVVQIFGQPTKARRKMREPGLTYNKDVPLEELMQNAASAELIYSPHKNYNTVRPPHSPYETLYLQFNEEGRLNHFDWYP